MTLAKPQSGFHQSQYKTNTWSGIMAGMIKNIGIGYYAISL